MSSKKTILWLAVAALLFSFIYFYQRHVRPAPSGPAKVLPELRIELVTSSAYPPVRAWLSFRSGLIGPTGFGGCPNP